MEGLQEVVGVNDPFSMTEDKAKTVNIFSAAHQP